MGAVGRGGGSLEIRIFLAKIKGGVSGEKHCPGTDCIQRGLSGRVKPGGESGGFGDKHCLGKSGGLGGGLWREAFPGQ